MRKLIFATNISLDGCCDHTKFLPDDDTMMYFIKLVRDTDTFVYGRKTYELMVPYWHDVAVGPVDGRAVDHEFAKAYVAVSNTLVFSKSLNNTADEKTRIISANLQDEIIKLKQEPGKNILTNGVSIPSQLAALNLIDEFHFVVHPVVVGAGTRLLEGLNLQENLQFKLVESITLKSGVIALRYVKQ